MGGWEYRVEKNTRDFLIQKDAHKIIGYWR